MVKADGGDGRGRHDTEIVWNFRGRGLLEIGGHNMIDSFSGCWEAIQEEYQAEFRYMTSSYSACFHLLLSGTFGDLLGIGGHKMMDSFSGTSGGYSGRASS